MLKLTLTVSSGRHGLLDSSVRRQSNALPCRSYGTSMPKNSRMLPRCWASCSKKARWSPFKGFGSGMVALATSRH